MIPKKRDSAQKIMLKCQAKIHLATQGPTSVQTLKITKDSKALKILLQTQIVMEL